MAGRRDKATRRNGNDWTMAGNIEDYINRKRLEDAGGWLREHLLEERPLLLPIVLALLLALVAWSVFRGVGGEGLGLVVREGAAATDAGAAPGKPEVKLSRDLWAPPTNHSYSLSAVYTSDGVDIAIINGQDCKVGDRVGAAKVVEIGVHVVKIQEDGKDAPTELRWMGEGLPMEAVQQPTPTPAPTATPAPTPAAASGSPMTAPSPTATPEAERASAGGWDWSTWPGPPEFMDHIEGFKEMLDNPEKRAEARREIEEARATGQIPPELNEEAVQWLLDCLDWYDQNS